MNRANSRLRRIVAGILPFLLIVAAFPAFGLFGIGDAAIIANQVTQIAAQVTQIAEAAQAVINLEDQLNQEIAQALGQVGALVEAFDQLSSDPMSLLNDITTVTWAGDFAGDPRQLLTAITEMPDPNLNPLTDHWRNAIAQADTVSRGRMRNVLRHVPNGTHASDAWLARRDLADRTRIFDYTALDSAERISELLGTASDAVARSRSQTNLADTALAQEQLANQLTTAEVMMAAAELDAQGAVRDAMERQTLELLRLRQLEAWTNAVAQQRQRVDNFRNRTRSLRGAINDSLLLN